MKYVTGIYDLDNLLKVKLDKRELIDGVPISYTMHLGVKVRSDIRHLKHKVKRLFKRK